MAVKRLPLSFPELEPKGRKAILRTAEEVQAEEGLLEDQHASMPESGHAGSPAFQNARMPASQGASAREGQQSSSPEFHHAGKPVSQSAGERSIYSKATYRLSLEAIEAIEDAKRILRRRYGIRASLEEIAEEAILEAHRDLLENQHASFLVSRLPGKSRSRGPKNGQ